MQKAVLGIICLLLMTSFGYCQESNQPLQITINSDKQVYKVGEQMSIRVEFKNVSSKPIKLLDFQDNPPRWQAPASYFRCMVLGFNQEPVPYQLLTTHIEKYITLEPGAIYPFVQNYNGSVELTAKLTMNKLKLIYDTKIFAEGVWEGDYWKGRLDSNEISLVIEKSDSTFTTPSTQKETQSQRPTTGPYYLIKPERKIEKVYYLDGALFSETDLFSDKYNGFYKTYHRNGQIATEIHYKDGFQIYDKAFDEQGRPMIRNGIFKTYYADGHLASLGEYRNDLKNGEEKFYYYDGSTIVDIWHYMNGRQVGEHIRNDNYGHFLSRDDWGYPMYFVRVLQNTIFLLGGLVILFLIGLGLYMMQKRNWK